MSQEIHAHIDCLMKEKWGGLDVKLDSLLATQQETLAQVQKTNGRVTALERWRTVLMTALAVIAIQSGPDALARLVSLLSSVAQGGLP
jgi:hypothetical protein